MAGNNKYNGRMTYASPDRYGLLKVYARENRKNMTLAERVLWMSLSKKFLGHKFYRQHIIGDYIVDFLCHEDGLIIEVKQRMMKSVHVILRIWDSMFCVFPMRKS